MGLVDDEEQEAIVVVAVVVVMMVVVVTMIPHLSEGPLVEVHAQVSGEQVHVIGVLLEFSLINCVGEEDGCDDGNGGKFLAATNCPLSSDISPVSTAVEQDPSPGVKRASTCGEEE